MVGKLPFLCVLFTVAFCYDYKKPDKPCLTQDNTCVTKMVADIFTAAVNGDPSEGFEAIDPMHHDIIVADLPTINFTITNSTVVGLKGLEVISANISDHDSVYITVIIPQYEMRGMYEMDGVFFNTPIIGNGNFALKGTDVKIDIEAIKYYYRKPDGIYLKIKRFEFTAELVGKLHVDIDNLYKGIKELADATLNILNSHTKMLAAAWNTPITRANFEKIFKNINKVHSDVLLTDLVVEDLSTKTINDD